jgi:hypothetical protein
MPNIRNPFRNSISSRANNLRLGVNEFVGTSCITVSDDLISKNSFVIWQRHQVLASICRRKFFSTSGRVARIPITLTLMR